MSESTDANPQKTAPPLAPPSRPDFDAAFRSRLRDLFVWRRDVRRFRGDAVAPALLEELLTDATLAPSVGYSQPWRFVIVETEERRAAVLENFRRCNREALSAYAGERAKLYASLKLAGLAEAPVHLAVFCDESTAVGRGLGRQTMPETLRYSVVMAVHTLWLTARAHGLGIGWISILDAKEVHRTLDLPAAWSLVAYLCLGYPEAEHASPELARTGWEQRQDPAASILRR
jgi:5,6-dimethylbenzimidazole synthase